MHELLVVRLRDDLAGGLWRCELPGVRELMRYYGVSLPPVLAALDVLEREGCIGPVRAGRRRLIRQAAATPEEPWFLLCRPSFESMTAMTAKNHRLITQEWENSGIRWRTVVRNEARAKDCIEEIRALVTAQPGLAGAVGLDVYQVELRAALGAEMPLLMLGAKVVADDRCAAIRLRVGELVPSALRYLLGRGVQGVAIVPALVQRSVYDYSLPLVAQAYREFGIPFVAEQHFPWVDPGTLPAVLRTMIRSGNARVLVTIEDTIWPRVLWEVQRLRADVEVIALWPSAPMFAAFENPPRLCEVNFEDYIKWTMEWCQEVRLGRVPCFERNITVRGVWKRA